MKNSLQSFFVVSILLFSSIVLGQNVGIGTSTPDQSAKLEINSTSSGILVPRVALVASNNGLLPINNPATSLLVYNTATAGISPNEVTPGYYYWDGYWVRLSTGPASNDWKINGNSGTIGGTNFIGTTDAVDFVTKTNGLERMRVKSNGLVGIGLNPSYKLDVLHSSTTADDRAVNISYTTSGNTGPWNTGLNVVGNSTADGDLFGILSTATQTGNGRGSAIAGIVSGSGSGDKIAIASQIGGSGDDGAGLTSAVSGNWTNAYGLMVEFTSVSAIQNRYGIYVKGDVDYSAFMENGNLYVNDNVGIGINADPPQAKLHVDGNIKSTFLQNSGSSFQNKRVLYTNVDGQITPIPNGNEGDVLKLNASGEPVWGASQESKIHFSQLTSGLTTTGGMDLILEKQFIALHDTVIVNFNVVGSIANTTAGYDYPLSPFRLWIDVNGAMEYNAYIFPSSNEESTNLKGRYSNSISIPVQCDPGNINVVSVFIEGNVISLPGTFWFEIDPFDGDNASLIIYDMPTNE